MVTHSGEVSTIAGDGCFRFKDGDALHSSFTYPSGIDVDADGNLFISDGFTNKIRKLSPIGQVSIIAGSVSGFKDGPSLSSMFACPEGLVISENHKQIFVCDTGNNRIRRVDLKKQQVTTFAGSGEKGALDGDAKCAQFNYPAGIAIDFEETLSWGTILIIRSE